MVSITEQPIKNDKKVMLGVCACRKIIQLRETQQYSTESSTSGQDSQSTLRLKGRFHLYLLDNKSRSGEGIKSDTSLNMASIS